MLLSEVLTGELKARIKYQKNKKEGKPVDKSTQTYKIHVSGRGYEVHVWELTQEQYEFWEDNEDELVDYGMGAELEIEVPSEMDFLNGVLAYCSDNMYHGPSLEPKENMISIEDNSGNHILFECSYNELISKGFYNSILSGVVENGKHYYVYVSEDKGDYATYDLETQGEIDYTKLQFHISYIPNYRDFIITGLSYDGLIIDKMTVGDTDSRSCSAFLIEY